MLLCTTYFVAADSIATEVEAGLVSLVGGVSKTRQIDAGKTTKPENDRQSSYEATGYVCLSKRKRCHRTIGFSEEICGRRYFI